jgi:DTW domain-containing protein YfiP
VRAQCYTCDKPAPLCLCGSLPRVDNRTAITILQHPRERRHPVGTARLARLGLTRARLEVCYQLRASEAARALQSAPRVGVLYPSPQARDLTSDAPLDHLLVLDGTWTGAKGLYQANPWLESLPHYRIAPDGVDRYRIRSEPRADYTSTLEAIVTALRIVEPATPGLDALLGAFEAMIDRQVACIGQAQRGKRRRERPRLQNGPIPAPLRAHPERVVVVYGEFTLDPRQGHTGPKELLYWTAHRLDTGETFAAEVKPETLVPEPTHLDAMGLGPEVLARGHSVAELREAFAAFLPEAPLFVAWNQTTLDLLTCHLQPEASAWLLKGMYCNLTRRGSGHLEEALARLGLAASPLPCRGRAGARLGNAATMARHLLATG